MGAGLIIAIVCAMAALLYGALSIKWIVALPSGNERMREIATAIQQGASAYLNRQYATIGIVGLILLVAIFAALGWQTAVGFALGAFVWSCWLCGHECFCSCQCAHSRSSQKWSRCGAGCCF